MCLHAWEVPVCIYITDVNNTYQTMRYRCTCIILKCPFSPPMYRGPCYGGTEVPWNAFFSPSEEANRKWHPLYSKSSAGEHACSINVFFKVLLSISSQVNVLTYTVFPTCSMELQRLKPLTPPTSSPTSFSLQLRKMISIISSSLL